ncbi:MAG: cysteine peptidase family C39 domain-containing protein [Treponema sp.]|nr:cysteine peptidase family C39 domain-containing protein [Treponema sp.]
MEEANFQHVYRMNWDELAQALAGGFAPLIVHYDRPSGHFALLLHIEGDFAFVADPSYGLALVDRATFLRRFSGNALLAGRIWNNVRPIEKF